MLNVAMFGGSRNQRGIFYVSNSCHQKLLFLRFLPFNPSHRRYRSSVSPLYFALQHPAMLRDTAREKVECCLVA